MKVVNKVKFKTRIAELLIIIATIVLTIISVNYANNWRGYNAMGGEYLIPVMGFVNVNRKMYNFDKTLMYNFD